MTSLERLLLNRISVHFVNKWFTWRKAPIDWNARCRARQVGGYQLISFLFSSTFSVFLWMDSLEFQIFGVQFCLFFVTWKSYANLLVEIAELTEIPLIPSFSNFHLITNQCLKIKKKNEKKNSSLFIQLSRRKLIFRPWRQQRSLHRRDPTGRSAGDWQPLVLPTCRHLLCDFLTIYLCNYFPLKPEMLNTFFWKLK